MRYWFDTEFIEDGKTIDLLSIDIVAEDGRSYYAESSQTDRRRGSPWVQENVINRLMDPREQGNSHHHIATMLKLFCDPEKHGKPEFWAYYADYDWVVLCQLFGTMMDLPKGWPMYCRDIKQWCDMLGNPPLPEQGKGEHHALGDAIWNQKAWEFLRTYKAGS